VAEHAEPGQGWHRGRRRPAGASRALTPRFEGRRTLSECPPPHGEETRIPQDLTVVLERRRARSRG
jgi:hypothetical protein